eukprot:CAMPEP_0119563000 /NCGR_PEP_ID=MMETSP1352-20130426/22188_1 /TAXON_ID=265584 /ORGANISM="Stauroneis constricta, Strain CCMP1120" /LENGTH=443 /DNA_ID=CAMNT_0007611523 /DNA_START=173 /DNA_END=1501 /DNA_ORIENTATION=-
MTQSSRIRLGGSMTAMLMLALLSFTVASAAAAAATIDGDSRALKKKSEHKDPVQTGKPICADPDTNIFVALVSDTESYDDVVGIVKHAGRRNPDAEGKEQRWVLVKEKSNAPKAIRNSLTGHYLQLMPDYGVSYPGQGEHVHSVQDDLQLNDVPYINFRLSVAKGKAGWHTVFIRWTGGDEIGGGDSFFVSMFRHNKHGYPNNQELVTGQRTLKPAVVPITSGAMDFAGCCYDPQTHACPCYKKPPSPSECSSEYFIGKDRASSFGAQCPVGPGVMEFVKAPQWYLFAGQSVGDIMDFAAEPWDGTCEAEGSNTADSGQDFASWELEQGEYDLRIYAREDGTAIDAIFVAGPDADAPGATQTYKAGDTTFCRNYPAYQKAKKRKRMFKFSFVGFLVVASIAFGLFVKFTDQGQMVGSRISMMYRSIFGGGGGVAREAILQYEP